jgi:hypothetical protein
MTENPYPMPFCSGRTKRHGGSSAIEHRKRFYVLPWPTVGRVLSVYRPIYDAVRARAAQTATTWMKAAGNCRRRLLAAAATEAAATAGMRRPTVRAQ